MEKFLLKVTTNIVSTFDTTNFRAVDMATTLDTFYKDLHQSKKLHLTYTAHASDIANQLYTTSV